jgi:hypothetical protein
MKSVVSLAALCAFLCLGLSAAFVSAKDAAAETTIKGTACCAKCELKQTTACHAALKVTEDGKEVVYLVDGPEGSKLHKEVCKSTKDGVSVTGVVSTDKDGHKHIKASKVEG